MIQVSEIRKRLRQALEQVKRERAERRARADQAAHAYEAFLTDIATPVFRMFSSVLKADGHPFSVFTPAGGLRLMSERSNDDFIELFLDAEADPPVVSARVSRGRGRRLISAERAVREEAAVDQLTDEDVVEFLLREIVQFVER
jgi:hypothetical protein